jgi:TolB-like protein/Tfp pilus assembly protein PilF
MSLLAELKRRKLMQWALAYAAGAWALLQALSLLISAYHWPDAVLRIAIVVVAIGFLITLVLAWYHGERGEQRVSRNEMLLLSLLLALGGGLAWRTAHAPDATASNAAVLQAIAAANAVAPKKSIAVLPFVNMSGDKDNEYFSDGMSEEILNALAKVKDLKVAGRTSSFYYKNRNEDLRSIGRALGVANVLEGSVRKQGEKVRITAQLIRTDDDFHLWSETYDGDLKDVFALQERIARAITDQLQVVLAGKQAERLVNAGTENPEAYSLYLQATSIFNRRDREHYEDAIAALQNAIELDPKFARAYSRLAALYVVLATTSGESLRSLQDKVAANAKQASALDPSLAEPYAALGVLQGDFPGGLVAQRQSFDRALAIDADDVTTSFWYGLTMLKMGYVERGRAFIDHALEKDPMLPNALRWRGIMYYYAGDTAHAEMYLNRARDVGLKYADLNLAEIAKARGDKTAAIQLYASGTTFFLSYLPPGSNVAIAQGIYGDAAARARALALLDDVLAKPHDHIPGMIAVSLFLLGEPAKALAAEHKQLTADTTDFLALLWSPRGKVMRDLPEFQPFLRDFGFVDLWDKYGPPDICRKNDKGEYACE